MDVRKTLIELITASGACFECFPVGDYAKEETEKIADYLITHGVTVQQWIPVTERLPKDRKERVLVKLTDANSITGTPAMDTDRYVIDEWVRYGDFVTHWMPLPEPPKEEKV